LSRLKVTNLPIDGLKLIERETFDDSRGHLTRLFCATELRAAGWAKPIAQINHTYTLNKGTVRGMHYQRPPYSEMKLVSCIRGELFDVAVDLRVDSNTYLQYHSELLSAENGKALLIPEGFAHGIQALTDDVELIYCHSMFYNADAEAGLSPRDKRLSIEWPLPITEISDRDQNHPLIDQCFEGLGRR
jgi:dTDP-4-dehydrorhamnose 3,5-epimerase